LTKASREGNQLATAILATKQSTPASEIDKLKSKIQEAKDKGDTVTASLLTDLGTTELPDNNTVQPAEKEDYDEVEKLWEENYRTLPVPAEYGSDRSAWVAVDTKYVEETISLLESKDTTKQQEGQKRVSDIMPMLLLGGFSTTEILGYLKAKLAAGTKVLVELQKEEENKVEVSGTEKKEQTNTMQVEAQNEEEKQVKS